jgi:hypothetical protein
MTGAQDLFESFTESDSGMYMELGMRTKHVVQGFGTMYFRWSQGMCCEWQMCYGCQECVLILND